MKAGTSRPVKVPEPDTATWATAVVEPASVVFGHTTTTIRNGAVSSGFKAITSTGGAFEIRGLDAAGYRLDALDRGRPMRAKR